MTYQDKNLQCRDCEGTFVFTASEQEFFKQKGLVNEPKRCPDCRIVVRAIRQGKPAAALVAVKCDECGVDTKSPFKPTGRRPVLCMRCLHGQRANQTVQLV